MSAAGAARGVSTFSGAAALESAGAEAWAPARVNLPLAPGDRLDTGELRMLAFSILVAGTDTTRSQLAASMQAETKRFFTEHLSENLPLTGLLGCSVCGDGAGSSLGVGRPVALGESYVANRYGGWQFADSRPE